LWSIFPINGLENPLLSLGDKDVHLYYLLQVLKFANNRIMYEKNPTEPIKLLGKISLAMLHFKVKMQNFTYNSSKNEIFRKSDDR
jgi:hypothetical protein